MEHIKIQEFKSTTLAAVTLDTIRQTPIWQRYQDEKGNVDPSKEYNVISAALYSMGYDIEGESKFTKRRGSFVVRSSEDFTKGVITEIYDFRLRKDHPLETFFMNNNFVHIDSEHSSEFVELSEHGLEYYEISPRKSEKQDSKEDSISEDIDNQESFYNAS